MNACESAGSRRARPESMPTSTPTVVPFATSGQPRTRRLDEPRVLALAVDPFVEIVRHADGRLAGRARQRRRTTARRPGPGRRRRCARADSAPPSGSTAKTNQSPSGSQSETREHDRLGRRRSDRDTTLTARTTALMASGCWAICIETRRRRRRSGRPCPRSSCRPSARSMSSSAKRQREVLAESERPRELDEPGLVRRGCRTPRAWSPMSADTSRLRAVLGRQLPEQAGDVVRAPSRACPCG